MRRSPGPTFVLAALFGCLAAGLANDARGQSGKPDGVASSKANPENRPLEPDAAFNRFVNITELHEALSSLNSAAFVDNLLQLAEGERVLLRSHRSGASLKSLLPLAIRLAVDQRDKESLNRLEKAAARAGLKDMQEEFALAKQLTASPRTIRKTSAIPIGEVDEDGLRTYRFLKNEIKRSGMVGDKKALKELGVSLVDWPDLTPVLIKELKAGIAAALAEAPDPSDPTVELLKKMLAGTRANVSVATDYGGGILSTAPSKVPGYPLLVVRCKLNNKTGASIIYNVVGSGKSYSMAPKGSHTFMAEGKVTPGTNAIPADDDMAPAGVNKEGASHVVVAPKIILAQELVDGEIRPVNVKILTNGEFDITGSYPDYKVERVK